LSRGEAKKLSLTKKGRSVGILPFLSLFLLLQSLWGCALLPIHEGLRKTILLKDGFLAQRMYPSSLKATGIVQPEFFGQKEPKTRFNLVINLDKENPVLQMTGTGAIGVQLYNLFFKNAQAGLYLSDSECYWEDVSGDPERKELWQNAILWAFSPWSAYNFRSGGPINCDGLVTEATSEKCAAIKLDLAQWQGIFAFNVENFAPLHLENQHISINYTAWRQMPDGLMFPIEMAISFKKLDMNLNVSLKDITLSQPEQELGLGVFPSCPQTKENQLRELVFHLDNRLENQK